MKQLRSEELANSTYDMKLLLRSGKSSFISDLLLYRVV